MADENMTAPERAPGDRWVYDVCRRCDRRIVTSFWVDDDVWRDVAESFYRLCMACFDELADEKSVRYVFKAVHVVSWSQGMYGEWPHLDVPCAECVGRASRGWHHQRKQEAVV